MVDNCKTFTVGYCDEGNIYLMRIWTALFLERVDILDEQYLRDYVDDHADFKSDWQDAVYNWYTESGYDEWVEDIDYDSYFDNYFSYSSELCGWYDEYADGYLSDRLFVSDFINWEEIDKQGLIERLISYFDIDYQHHNFEFRNGVNEQVLRSKMWEFFDECVEYNKQQEESRKPHYDTFNYYK